MQLKRAPLMDGEQRHAAHPRTFLIPSLKKRQNLKIGDWVKIGPDGERFWCEVFHKTKTGWLGRIGNHLVRSHRHGYYFADCVEFEPRHVLDWGPPAAK